jgi:hypothetical protein
VLRSHLFGRADPALVDKAARMVHAIVEQFWAGPDIAADATSYRPERTNTAQRRTVATGTARLPSCSASTPEKTVHSASTRSSN